MKGKKAITHYQIIKSLPSPKFGAIHLVELQPETGRKHQLRIHMSRLGCPILGDRQHGKEEKTLLGKGLFLHASSLAFIHPFSEENISITTPLPKKFQKILENKIAQEIK